MANMLLMTGRYISESGAAEGLMIWRVLGGICAEDSQFMKCAEAQTW